MRGTTLSSTSTIGDIALPGEWSRTDAGDNSVVHKDDTIVILSTDAKLEVLGQSSVVFMDDTFKGTQSMPFDKDHVRRCMGMWLSNGLHHLWCETGQCYVAREECTGLQILWFCWGGQIPPVDM